MDVLTQGVLGAALPQTAANKPLVARAGLFGFLAGMTADLDVFIRSTEDPLLFLEFHRQFTHSLIFIPVGGLLCGLLLYGILGKRWKLTLGQSVFFCTLGYATHALLDSSTSFGTQLLWPFSDERFAWNIISIVDPFFTIPLLLGIVVAGIKQNPLYARAGLIWAILYLSFGVFQRDAATTMGRQLASERGHTVLQIESKPSFANFLVWKIVYETPERFYVDAVRPTFSPKIFTGNSIAKLDVTRDFKWLARDSQQARDIERFRGFSAGYVAQDPANPNRIIDVRYSMIPNEILALWSIELSRSVPTDAHVQFRTNRERVREKAETLWKMLFEK